MDYSTQPSIRLLPMLKLLLLVGALLVSQTGCRIPRHPVESMRVLKDIAAKDQPSRWKELKPEPVRSYIGYEIEGRRHQADLYLPREPVLAGLVLVPGAAEKGKDDPRLVAFANTLARAQFAVVVPDLEQVRRLDLGPAEIQDVGDAAAYLASREDLAPGGRVGIGATSYAVGPAVLAALLPDLREKVRFVVGVGGYYDLEEAMIFFVTGHYRKPGGREWRYLRPNDYGKWVFVLGLLDRVDDAGDRRLLEGIARRKLDDPDANVEDLARQLGPEGRAYYEFLTSKEPERAAELMERLPSGFRGDLAALNVARADLSRLRARLILIHGKDDNIIPYTESVALARAAPNASLYLIKNLMHVDLEGVGFWDGLRLLGAVDEILSERTRKGR